MDWIAWTVFGVVAGIVARMLAVNRLQRGPFPITFVIGGLVAVTALISWTLGSGVFHWLVGLLAALATYSALLLEEKRRV